MPSPSESFTSLRPDLASSFEEFDLEMQRRRFIAQQLLPVIDVVKPSGHFGKVPIEQLLGQIAKVRAPGGDYSRGSFRFGKLSFSTDEYGWEEPVDRREAAMYAEYFDAEQLATMRAYEAVLQGAEQRAAALLYDTSTLTEKALTNEWDDHTNATPAADVLAQRLVIFGKTGIYPDTLVLNRKQFLHARECDEIIDRLKYSGHTNPMASAITPSVLADVFDLRQVLVADSAKNTANEGQTASISPTWSDEYMLLCKVAQTRDPREPCIARTFHYAEDGSAPGGTVEEYEESKTRSKVIRVRHDVEEKIVYAELAVVFSNAIT